MLRPRSFLATTTGFVAVGLFIGALTDGYVQATASGTYGYVHLFTEVLDEVKRNYVDEKDPKDLVYSSIRGMLRDLDPHSVFLDEVAYGELRIDTKGSFGGLGIVISVRDAVLTVISPVEGTPAWEKGIQAGDKIVAIEDESTEGITTEEAVTKLRGPRGTDVTITVAREGIPETFDYTITRDVIAIKSIPYSGIVGDDVGYVRLGNFSEHAGEELRDALDEVLREGARSLILDLRNNSGGLLDQAVAVSDLFVEKSSLIVYTKGRQKSDSREWYAKNEQMIRDIPVVVMVNEGTASASEIVSGAIQDYDLGLIVGVNTYGKGSVQTVRNLSADTALKLTTAKYYTPSGRSIHRPERDYRRGRGTAAEKDETETPPEEFLTAGGRPVQGGGGIMPDFEVEAPDASSLFIEILRRDLLFKFAVTYTAAHDDLAVQEDFEVDEEMMAAFVEMLDEAEVEYEAEDLAAEEESLKDNIKRQIAIKLWGMEAGYRIGLDTDFQLSEALRLMQGARSLDDLLAAAERLEAEAAEIAAASEDAEEATALP